MKETHHGGRPEINFPAQLLVLLGRSIRRLFCETKKDILREIKKNGIEYKRDYDLIPPKTLASQRSFEDAVEAILEDWSDTIKIKVVRGRRKGGQGKTLKWMTKKDGKDLPQFHIRVLLFLYGRGFYHDYGEHLKDMVE